MTSSRKLSPVAWGQPDKALAAVVRLSFIAANPPTIIPWRPGHGAKLKRALHDLHLRPAIDDNPWRAAHRVLHTPPQEQLMNEVKIGQRVKTDEGHPFPFSGQVVGIRVVVRDEEGAEREVDSRFTQPAE